MKAIDSVFESLSASLATPVDQVKVIAIFLLSIPLAAGLPKLPASSNLTHVYSLALSWIFHTQILHLPSGFNQCLGQSIGTWIAVKYGRSSGRGKSWTWFIFIANMAVLTINHFARWVANTPLTSIEITGTQMVLVMKLTLFAWACYDGGKQDASKLDAVQQRDRLVQVPGLLPFLGYAFFFPSVMAGPTFSYASYAAFVDRSLFKSKGDGASERKEWMMPQGRYRKALKRFTIGAVYLGIYSTYGGSIGFERLLDPAFLAKNGFWKRVGFVQLAGFVTRTKYYAIWSLTETGMIVSGLGYDPETGKWNRGRNVMIRQIETAQSFKVLLDAWNCGTNYWLRECVYKRLAKPGRKPGFKSTMATFATSAFWHGFNPTYYITFLLAGFFQSLGRKLRTYVRPLVLAPDYAISSGDKKLRAERTPLKLVYDALSTICVQLSINFAVVPFILLEVGPSMRAWRSLGFYGILLCFVPFFAFELGLGRVLRDVQLERAKRAGVSTEAVEEFRKAQKKRNTQDVTSVPDVDATVKDGIKELR